MPSRNSRTRASRFSFTSSLFALAGGALAGLAPCAASADEPAETALHVSVTAPAGKGCISGEKLQHAVQKRVGSVARHTAVDVHIESAAPVPGWVASVAVAGRAGHRTVKTRSPSCGKLDDGLVLVVTLLVDPDEDDEETPPAALPAPPSSKPRGDEPSNPGAGGGSWAPDEPAEPEEKPEEEPESWPGARKPGDPAQDPAREPESERGRSRRGDKPPAGDEPSRDEAPSKVARATKGDPARGKGEEAAAGWPKKMQFALGASAVYSMGLAPAGLPGVRGSFAWLSPTPVPIEASFTYHSDYEEYTGNTTAFTYQQAMSFGVTSCPADVNVGLLHFGACAGMTVTRLQQRFQADSPYPMDPMVDESGPEYREMDHLMMSPTADLRLDVTLWKVLRVGAAVEVMTPINRPEIVALTDTYSVGPLTEPVIFQARLGISLVLPP